MMPLVTQVNTTKGVARKLLPFLTLSPWCHCIQHTILATKDVTLNCFPCAYTSDETSTDWENGKTGSRLAFGGQFPNLVSCVHPARLSCLGPLALAGVAVDHVACNVALRACRGTEHRARACDQVYGCVAVWLGAAWEK